MHRIPEEQIAASRKIADDVAAFLANGGKIKRVGRGVMAEAGYIDKSAQELSRMAKAVQAKKSGGKLTEKQRAVMQAIRELDQVPGGQITRQGIRNKTGLAGHVVGNRLESLEAKGLIKVMADKTIRIVSAG